MNTTTTAPAMLQPHRCKAINSFLGWNFPGLLGGGGEFQIKKKKKEVVS